MSAAPERSRARRPYGWIEHAFCQLVFLAVHSPQSDGQRPFLRASRIVPESVLRHSRACRVENEAGAIVKGTAVPSRSTDSGC